MVRFRNLFDTLKISVLNSYKKTSFLSRNLSRGINGLSAIVSSAKAASKQADELGRANCNIVSVKALWNILETGIPEKFVAWQKPNIKYVHRFMFSYYLAMFFQTKY